MVYLLEKLLPILLVILVGWVIRKTKILSNSIAEEFKTLIVKVALPAILFNAFGQSELKVEYIILFLFVFILCVLLYGMGYLLHRYLPKVFPFGHTDAYFTSFEFGMVGVALFSAIWGIEKLPIVMMIAFGHEIFVWFLYIPLLEYRHGGSVNLLETFKNFIKSPTIIAILLGMLMNIIGIYELIDNHFVGRSVLNALSMLSNIVTPLILLVIGYNLTFKSLPIKKALSYIFGRWLVILSLGSLMLLIIKLFINVDTFFTQAYYAFLILPPSFIFPLFIHKDNAEEQTFFSEILIYYTITSFIGYIILMSI